MASLAGAEFIEKHPKIKEHAKILSDEASTKYVESGAKKHVDTFKTKSGEKLDVVTGLAIYELLQERISLQDRYNDLLAAKLSEALERISELEKKLSKLNSSGDKS
jgi:DNA-binding transcriptional ArsR family regulator